MALKGFKRGKAQRWAVPESWRHRWMVADGLIVGELPDVYVTEPTPWPPPSATPSDQIAKRSDQKREGRTPPPPVRSADESPGEAAEAKPRRSSKSKRWSRG